jgi:hypothetical protein
MGTEVHPMKRARTSAGCETRSEDPGRGRPRRWRVWRRDDHGGRFEVSRGHTEEEARRIAADYESRGHKQLYEAEPE